MNKKNNKNIVIEKATDFDDFLKNELKTKKLKKQYEEFGKELEIAYQINKLRRDKKMSQSTLAKKIGTTQSNVARMESGQQNFTIGILTRIANAFGKELKISIN